MKKILLFAALIGIAVPAITSCIRPASSIKSGTTYSLEVSEDLLELCNIEISYRDEDGSIKTDTSMDNNSWSYWETQVIHYSTGYNTWMGFHLTLKPDVQLTKDEYNFFLCYKIQNKWPNDSSRGAMNTTNISFSTREQVIALIYSLNRLGNPIISIDVDEHQFTVVKGNKEDVELFDLNYSSSPGRRDSTTMVEEVLATQGTTTAQ